MQHIISVICGMLLLICAIQDLRFRMINVIVPLIAMVIIVAVKLLCHEETITGIALSISPGIVMLCISVIRKGVLGFADGIIVCFVGVCEGFYANAVIVLFSFVIAWIAILYKLIIKRYSAGRLAIPFIPCIIPAWLCVCAGGWYL